MKKTLLSLGLIAALFAGSAMAQEKKEHPGKTAEHPGKTAGKEHPGKTAAPEKEHPGKTTGEAGKGKKRRSRRHKKATGEGAEHAAPKAPAKKTEAPPKKQ